MYFFPVLFIETELFTEKRKKRSALNRSVGKQFDLQSRYSYKSKRNSLLYKSKKSFFRVSFLLSSYYVFFCQKNQFFIEIFNSGGCNFFEKSKTEENSLFFCRVPQSSFCITNMSFVVQKLRALVSL